MQTEGESLELDLRSYVDVLRRYWKSIASTALVVGALLVFNTARTASVYQASAQVLLKPGAFERITQTQVSTPTERLLANEISVMQSRLMRDRIETAVGRPVSAQISPLADGSDVVVVRASASTPEEAAQRANDFVEGYTTVVGDENDARIAKFVADAEGRIEVIETLLAQLGSPIEELDGDIASLEPGSPERESKEREREVLESRTSNERNRLLSNKASEESILLQVGIFEILEESTTAELLTPASPPSERIAPDLRRAVGVAIAVGVLAALAQAFLRARLDDRIRHADDLEKFDDRMTNLTAIPFVPGWQKEEASRLMALTAPDSVVAEAYRLLRTNLELLRRDDKLSTLQVTSARAGDGKTVTAANLAVTFCKAGLKVALVDGDLRRPRVHSYFGLSNEVGFSSVAYDSVPLREALQTVVDVPGLWILGAGPAPESAGELLRWRGTRTVIDRLAGAVDLVIVDSPPVLPVADALLISAATDATLFVVRAGTTSKRDVGEAIEQLHRVGGVLVGSVVNGEKATRQSYKYDYVETTRLRRRKPLQGIDQSRAESAATNGHANGHSPNGSSSGKANGFQGRRPSRPSRR